jgi:hypothetical protein
VWLPANGSAQSNLKSASQMTSSHTDFDFFHGEWIVKHRRLTARLKGGVHWEEFGGTCAARPVLGGFGNVDDNLLDLPDGAYRAITIRSFDAMSGLWAIWWLDGRHPHRLDVPVVGQFVDGIGIFLADDVYEDRPIKVRFRWAHETPGTCQWQQAFSGDGGKTWETNWMMDFTKAV